MQHFATHLRPGQQTTRSLRASQYPPSTKRKRDEDGEEAPISPADVATGPSAAQRRVAGPLHEAAFEVPAPPFPHAPARTAREHSSHARVQQEIAGLAPPVYAADATSKSHPVGRRREQPALRQSHLETLSTIMHRCLLEGDYDRARRAWGLILRTQVAGQPIDPRHHGRWGIGAELLLRRKPPCNHVRDEDSVVPGSHDEQSPPDEDEIYSDGGFELGREYYERLIVQHPSRKVAPHAVDERTFYPALFSLWILEVSERSKRARKEFRKLHPSRPASITSEGSTSLASQYARSQEAAIQAQELARAKEICERLDQLVVSPPFDKHPKLLRLRGMAGLWISDLIIGKAKSRTQVDWDMETSDTSLGNASESLSDKVKKHADSLRELRRAQECLHRAQAAGNTDLQETLYSVESKMNDLTRQMTRLDE